MSTKRIARDSNRNPTDLTRSTAKHPRGTGNRARQPRHGNSSGHQTLALPAGLSVEEMRAHFVGMPDRYWQGLDEADLRWHLAAAHGFFEKLARSSTVGSPVWVDWKPTIKPNHTRVVVCSWDRGGLLEQIVAGFGALRFAIHRADVYTRADSLALDVFEVRGPESSAETATDRLAKLAFLVEGAYTLPPRFASFWATQFHKVLPRRRGVPPAVLFDNRSSHTHTVLSVTAPDRQGLLYDVLHALGGHGLAVAQAVIETKGNRAKDQFHITDADGNKILNAARLKRLREDVRVAIES